MKIIAYVDESGVGGEDHCTVAAFVGKLGQWRKFDHHWRRLLSRSPASPDYAHLVEMQRRTGPFSEWDTSDIARFYRQGMKLILRHSLFGVSTTVSAADYAEYRSTIPPKTSPDSIYGVGVRLVLDFIVSHFRDHSPIQNPRVEVVFDRGNRTNEGLAIFDEMKRGYSDASQILDVAQIGANDQWPGLQITDYIVSRARRAEAQERVEEIRRPADLTSQSERVSVRPAPIFHIANDQSVLEVLQSEKPRLKSRLRFLRKKRAELSQ